MPLIVYLIALLAFMGGCAELVRWRSGRATFIEFLLFELIFAACIIGAFFPAILDKLALLVGMQLRAFFFFTSSIIIIAIFCFALYLRSENQRQTLVRLVQAMAILEEEVRRKGKGR